MTPRTENVSEGNGNKQPGHDQHFLISQTVLFWQLMACKLKFTDRMVPLPLRMRAQAERYGQRDVCDLC